MDTDGLTFACATTAEERVAKRAGLNAARVGVRVANGVPKGRLVSFGLAGALRDGLAIGEVLDVTRVVDEQGVTLWEGGPLGVPGARTATVLGSDVLVHTAMERRRLHDASGEAWVTSRATSSISPDSMRIISATRPSASIASDKQLLTVSTTSGWSGISRSPLKFSWQAT